MSLILGISAYYHDSAAAIVSDGKILAAASEERFSRQKGDSRFPSSAISECLSGIGASVADIDYVGFYEKPLLKFDRLMATYHAYAPRGYLSFAKAMPLWLRQKLHLPREIRGQLNKLSDSRGYQRRIVFCEHHQSHAASAFYPSPYDEAAILTMDGVGEWAAATWGIGSGEEISLLAEQRFPHSLGLLYSAMTYFCGFRVNSGEYKLMGLAPYGSPRYTDLLREKIVDIAADGSFRLAMQYFDYCAGLRMTSKRFDRLIGCSARDPESPIRQVDLDVAASIQVIVEEILIATATHIRDTTGQVNLCIAGGVALNCVANGRLQREGIFDNVWVQPAAGDAGGALGVALLIEHGLLKRERQIATRQVSEALNPTDKAIPRDCMRGCLLGPKQDHQSEVQKLLAGGAVARQHNRDEIDRLVAELLDDGKIVGWIQGRTEFGPRALGNRSILADARRVDMQHTLNQKIKFRESFRPFAPAVLEEHAGEYFEMSGAPSPYMLFTYPVSASRRRYSVDEAHTTNNDSQSAAPGDAMVEAQVLELARQTRSDIPAVTHVDYSARVQVVGSDISPRFHQLLTAFYERTQCPLLVNTSFNVRGEPIVHSAADAYKCFMTTGLDALVIEDWLLLKNDQKTLGRPGRTE